MCIVSRVLFFIIFPLMYVSSLLLAEFASKGEINCSKSVIRLYNLTSGRLLCLTGIRYIRVTEWSGRYKCLWLHYLAVGDVMHSLFAEHKREGFANHFVCEIRFVIVLAATAESANIEDSQHCHAYSGSVSRFR